MNHLAEGCIALSLLQALDENLIAAVGNNFQSENNNKSFP